MWDDNPDTRAALLCLGLDHQSTLADVKAAFRHKARTLHPDCTPASEQTLLELAQCIQAIRHLENCAPLTVDCPLTPAEANNGITRTLRHKGRSGVFRIDAGARDGDIIPAVGDPGFKAVILLNETELAASENPASGQLASFVSEFATREPAARFAGWLRKAHSAA